MHLGLRLIETRAAALEAEVRAELLHAVAVHHDASPARTAEAAVLYHANQLDAVAATRPVSARERQWPPSGLVEPPRANASDSTAAGTSR